MFALQQVGSMASPSPAVVAKGKGKGEGKAEAEHNSEEEGSCERCRGSLPGTSAGGGAQEELSMNVPLTGSCASCAEVSKSLEGREKEKEKTKAKAASCELCGKSILGASAAGGAADLFMNVSLTVACAACAEAFRNHDGMLLVCKPRAFQDFRLSQTDVGSLRVDFQYPPFQSFFVRAECEVGVQCICRVLASCDLLLPHGALLGRRQFGRG